MHDGMIKERKKRRNIKFEIFVRWDAYLKYLGMIPDFFREFRYRSEENYFCHHMEPSLIQLTNMTLVESATSLWISAESTKAPFAYKMSEMILNLEVIISIIPR